MKKYLTHSIRSIIWIFPSLSFGNAYSLIETFYHTTSSSPVGCSYHLQNFDWMEVVACISGSLLHITFTSCFMDNMEPSAKNIMQKKPSRWEESARAMAQMRENIVVIVTLEKICDSHIEYVNKLWKYAALKYTDCRIGPWELENIIKNSSKA